MIVYADLPLRYSEGEAPMILAKAFRKALSDSYPTEAAITSSLGACGASSLAETAFNETGNDRTSFTQWKYSLSILSGALFHYSLPLLNPTPTSAIAKHA